MTGKVYVIRTVAGWDDPRLFTISGLRKRGIPLGALNEFLDSIPVTRRGNDNYIQMAKFDHVVKGYLDKVCPRMMAVSDPIPVMILNIKSTQQCTAPSFPSDTSKGGYTANCSALVYLERNDFENQSDNVRGSSRGISVGSLIRLKYGPLLLVNKIETHSNGVVSSASAELVDQELISNEDKKRKVVHWVSKDDAIPCQINMYERLFLVEKPAQPADDISQRKAEMNPNSLTVYDQALINKSVLNQVRTQGRFQFERLGYFSVDQDLSDLDKDKLVFNRILESQPRKSPTAPLSPRDQPHTVTCKFNN